MSDARTAVCSRRRGAAWNVTVALRVPANASRCGSGLLVRFREPLGEHQRGARRRSGCARPSACRPPRAGLRSQQRRTPDAARPPEAALAPLLHRPGSAVDCSAIQAANRLPNGSACEPWPGAWFQRLIEAQAPVTRNGKVTSGSLGGPTTWLRYRPIGYLRPVGAIVADVNVAEAAVIGARAHGAGESAYITLVWRRAAVSTDPRPARVCERDRGAPRPRRDPGRRVDAALGRAGPEDYEDVKAFYRPAVAGESLHAFSRDGAHGVPGAPSG